MCSLLSGKIWTCPYCERNFSRINQSHTCKKFSFTNLFKNKPEFLKDLFGDFQTKLSNKNKVIFDPISFVINLKTPRKNFGMLFVEKDCLKVEFFLSYQINDNRIHKFAKSNKNWSYIVLVKEKKEIDEKLLNWLNDAYLFNS